MKTLALAAFGLLASTNLGQAQSFPSPRFKSVVIGTPQTTDVGQVGQVTLPYTAGMLNQNIHGFAVQLGPIDQTLDFASLDPALVNKTVSALTCSMASPSGTSGYGGAVGWPDACVASYVIANHTQKSAINYLAYGGVGADGGFVQNLNTVATNKPLGPDSGTGFNAAHINGVEVDINIYPLAGGGGMTGDIYAFQAFLSTTNAANLASASEIAAFRVVALNSAKWTYAFKTAAGAASIFADIGPVNASGISASQQILLHANNGSAPVLASIQVGTDGALGFVAPSFSFSGTLNWGGLSTSGTATGSLCIAGTTVFIKTTTGACK